jgi:hypothetical protein
MLLKNDNQRIDVPPSAWGFEGVGIPPHLQENFGIVRGLIKNLFKKCFILIIRIILFDLQKCIKHS